MGATDFGYTDPSTWRLSTSGGIPYKTIGMSGTLERDEGNVTVSVLIQSKDLLTFANEILPLSILIGDLEIPQRTVLAGTGLVAQRIRFQSHDDSLPIDPFQTDSGAGSKTYFPVIRCDIEYEPSESVDPDEDDPETFLEVTADASGEFIHSAVPGTTWESEDSETTEVNRNPSVPLVVQVPQTDWSVTRKSLDWDWFKLIMLPRLRSLIGRVNSTQTPWVQLAQPETLLMTGYSYTVKRTWISAIVGTPPIDVTIKVLEKRIVTPDGVIGHNHFWRPGVGWQRLKLANGRNVYDSTDFNVLWRP